MRHNQPHGISVLGGERLAVMMSCEQHIVTVEISQWYVRGISLLRMHQHVFGFGSRLDTREELAHRNTTPAIIEAAPARYAMEVAGALKPGELTELFPCEA